MKKNLSTLYRKTFSNSIYMMMVELKRRELISFIDRFCNTEKPSNKVYKVHEDNFFDSGLLNLLLFKNIFKEI